MPRYRSWRLSRREKRMVREALNYKPRDIRADQDLQDRIRIVMGEYERQQVQAAELYAARKRIVIERRYGNVLQRSA